MPKGRNGGTAKRKARNRSLGGTGVEAGSIGMIGVGAVTVAERVWQKERLDGVEQRSLLHHAHLMHTVQEWR
jgi:hypothetical protein